MCGYRDVQTGLHKDDGARIAVVSLAWYDIEAEAAGDESVEAPVISLAFPFDQGMAEGKPGYTGQVELFGGYDEVNLPREEWDALMAWLVRRGKALVFHNAPFDCDMFCAGTRQGWTGPDFMPQVVWDTQVAQKELDPTESVALKAAGVRWRLGDGDAAKEQREIKANIRAKKARTGGTRYDMADWEVMERYAAKDTEIGIRLARVQVERFKTGEGSGWAWLRREYDKMRALYAIQNRGMAFDTLKCLDGATLIRQAREQAARELPFPANINQAKRYWFAAPKDGGLGKIPYATTPQGKPKLDGEIVSKMVRDGVEHAETWQRWTQLDNALSKWYEAYPAMCGSDGRLRQVFNQTSVRSGRTSVGRVNLQAIPHDYQIIDRLPDGCPTIRGCITSAPGTDLWSLDLAQAELRVAARWAPCPKMLDLVLSGADAHGFTAQELFGSSKEDADWMMFRQVAKRANFSMIFDVGGRTFQQTLSKYLGLEWPVERCEEIVRRWRNLYPEFRRAVYKVMRQVEARGYVKLINGRISWFEPYEVRVDSHKGFNRFVQASLAEMGSDWMLWIEEHHPGVLVNWVHDAAYLEVPKGPEGEAIVADVKQAGIRIFTELFDVQGDVDAHLEAHGPELGMVAA